MPPVPPIVVTAFRKHGWKGVLAGARWLYAKGQDRLERNLSKSEQRELKDLLVRSKGRRRNLTDKQAARLRTLVRTALAPTPR